MATQVQIRRGTTVSHSSFTGAIAELTFDTDLKTVRAHDGTVAGGIVLAKASDVTGNLVLKANVTDLTTANVSEVTNLYFTNTRVIDALATANVQVNNLTVSGILC